MHLTDVITSIISALVQQLGVAEVVLLSSESWVSIAVFGKIQKRVRSLVIKISAKKKNYRRLQNLISNFEFTLRIYVTRLLKTLFFFFAFHLIYHSKILFTCYKWKKKASILFFSHICYCFSQCVYHYQQRSYNCSSSNYQAKKSVRWQTSYNNSTAPPARFSFHVCLIVSGQI